MLIRNRMLNYFSTRDRGEVLVLLFAVCLTYLPFLGNPLVFDDISFISSGAAEDIYVNAFDRFNLRWFPYTSLGWTAHVFSDAVPHIFRLGNIFIHAGNVILLFYLLRQLLGVVENQLEHQSSLIRGAWFGALIFALHPVAVYAAGYAVQRSILMATFFTLLMEFAYLRALLTGKGRWLFLTVLAYFLACFSKEHSVLAPSLLFAIHILFRANNIPVATILRRNSLWLCWSAIAAIGVIVLLLSKGVLGVPYEPMAAYIFEQQNQVVSTSTLHLLSALNQAGLFFKYLLLWLLPNPAWLSIDMREHFIFSLSEWQPWAGGLFFIAYGLLALRMLVKGGLKSLFGFALLYPWLQFMVELSSIRVQEPFVLYRSYLWLPGMMLMVPLLLLILPSRRVIVMLSMIVILLLPLSWNRLWVFSDNYRLWNDAATMLPEDNVSGADRIFFNRGQAQATLKNWDGAVADFRRAVALAPRLAPVHYQLGMAYVNIGDGQHALEEFEKSIEINPKDSKHYLGKGLALMNLKQKELAHQQLKISCSMGEQLACMIAD